MRDYIILNNKNSNEIQGLLIQNLPPITKPRIRAEIEEIDGRDGDIVTPLGYGAYDKAFSIGLYGDFDINEVIKYFDSEGIVVFSNEPNKYYNYKILEQIDFEKLIRFRTADVMMHVQPFKYSTTEGKETEEMETKTASGSEIDLPDTNNEKLQMEKLKGDAHQDTIDAEEGNENEDTNLAVNDVDPSKENYITLKGNTTQYNHDSVNMLPNDMATLSLYGITITKNDDGTYTINGTTTRDFNWAINDTALNLQANTNYFLSGCATGGDAETYCLYISAYADTGNGVLINSSRAINDQVRIFIASGQTFNNAIFKPMLIEGTEAIPFEPYGMTTPSPDYPSEVKVVTGNNTIKISNEDGTLEANYPINLGNLELCKIGDYKDYLFKRNGKWYVHKAIGKIVLDGTNTAFSSKSGQVGNSYVLQTNFINNPSTSTIPYVFSNKFKPICWNDRANYNDNAVIFGYLTANTLNFRFGTNSSITTLELANSWLETNNVNLYGVLATPTEEEITDTTLIAQLDNLHTAELQETSYINSTPAKEYPYINLKYNVVTPAPSPDRASEINKVTGNNVVSVQGKNLLNPSVARHHCNVNNDTGIITITTNATDVYIQGTYVYSEANKFLTLPSGNYYLKSTNPNVRITFYGDVASLNTTSQQPQELNSETNFGGIRIRSNSSLQNVSFGILLSTTDDTYVPYSKTDYPISLGNIELCKIGDYKDYFHKDSGKWYVHKEIGKKIFDGTETWNISGTNTADVYRMQTAEIKNYILPPTATSIPVYALCSRFIVKSADDTYKKIEGTSSSSVGNIHIYMNDYNTSTSVTDFKTWLSNNNVTLYYVLATPTEEEITDETLLAQLEVLDNIYNQKGTTYIKTNPEANNMPLSLDVSYTESRPITITNSGNIYSKPIFTIYGEGNIGVYLNDIQLFDINLGSEEQITIDVAEMQAYNKGTKALKNRLVTGNYDNFVLKVGENKISFSGIVKKFEIENYSRWI